MQSMLKKLMVKGSRVFAMGLLALPLCAAQAAERSPVDLSGWEISIDGVPVCSDPSLDFAKREVQCVSDAVKRAQAARAEQTQQVQQQSDELLQEQNERLKQVQRQCRSDASYASVLGDSMRYELTRNVCLDKASGREQPCPDCPVIVRSPKPPAPTPEAKPATEKR